MAAPRFIDHEVLVALNVTTTDDDVRAALARSGITPGALIGEALIESIEIYSADGEEI